MVSHPGGLCGVCDVRPTHRPSHDTPLAPALLGSLGIASTAMTEGGSREEAPPANKPTRCVTNEDCSDFCQCEDGVTGTSASRISASRRRIASARTVPRARCCASSSVRRMSASRRVEANDGWRRSGLWRQPATTTHRLPSVARRRSTPSCRAERHPSLTSPWPREHAYGSSERRPEHRCASWRRKLASASACLLAGSVGCMTHP